MKSIPMEMIAFVVFRSDKACPPINILATAELQTLNHWEPYQGLKKGKKMYIEAESFKIRQHQSI